MGCVLNTWMFFDQNLFPNHIEPFLSLLNYGRKKADLKLKFLLFNTTHIISKEAFRIIPDGQAQGLTLFHHFFQQKCFLALGGECPTLLCTYEH